MIHHDNFLEVNLNSPRFQDIDWWLICNIYTQSRLAKKRSIKVLKHCKVQAALAHRVFSWHTVQLCHTRAAVTAAGTPCTWSLMCLVLKTMHPSKHFIGDLQGPIAHFHTQYQAVLSIIIQVHFLIIILSICKPKSLLQVYSHAKPVSQLWRTSGFGQPYRKELKW